MLGQNVTKTTLSSVDHDDDDDDDNDNDDKRLYVCLRLKNIQAYTDGDDSICANDNSQ